MAAREDDVIEKENQLVYMDPSDCLGIGVRRAFFQSRTRFVSVLRDRKISCSQIPKQTNSIPEEMTTI